MSAQLVSTGHIDVLVHALVQYGVVAPDLDPKKLSGLGKKLWQQNHTAANHGSGLDAAAPRYRWRTTDTVLEPIVVLRALAYYNYHCCGYHGWFGSDAHGLMDALHTAVLDQHPDLGELVNTRFGKIYHYTTLPAWEATPWGIEKLEDVLPAPASTRRAGR
ncbi:hypothetical protein NQK81_01420 [Amycolatopsis roodepoortensis]|uniref:hypothetical protein n=1 Tax=Amycolatopsis roodepoortensis TaxID=700274 RepID=UPI00214AE073|nr:hypothetical protein [Amycolatopsis roodepoortensis]UUV32135.1 hypothetical protein NQK81_01420 [Amycolatopsis roodepoortensis]